MITLGSISSVNLRDILGYPSLLFEARRAVDVLEDLKFQEEVQSVPQPDPSKDENKKNNGLYLLQTCLVSVLISQILVYLLLPRLTAVFLVAGLIAIMFGYATGQFLLKAQEVEKANEVTYYLPIMMERVLMAVQSGLDIVPALKVLDSLDQSPNPVANALSRVVQMTESGLNFAQALEEAAKAYPDKSLKHVFIHLSVAHSQGGEIIQPLRELSETSQNYYQETVEEHIAKMPVKATFPLLLIFAGLIVTFLTGPVIQIMNLSKQNSKLEQEYKQNSYQESSDVYSTQ